MSADISSNNKRIAKNTLLLYIRTIFTMLISLYTSRVILEALGVEDYGIYNVVGGVVAMFSMISGSLSSAISRFITFELGKGNKEKLHTIFCTSVNIQIGISAVILILGCTAGLWFLNNYMNIPEGRMEAANWVLICSLLMFCINLVSVPYNACIIAHERMSAFAYIGVLEAVLKLVICYLIIASPFDRLISYAVLLVGVAILIRFIYGIYCSRNFEECHYQLIHDKTQLKSMTGFAGWNFFTSTSTLFNSQGVNILVNLFFGVTLNAARGIAIQVESAVLQFVNNFTTAINPQITKSYATGDLNRTYSLICRGAKFSYFAMLMFALPLICEAETILGIWLVEVPEYAVIFTQLSLIMGALDCVGFSGYTACMATGNIKRYALTLTPFIMLEFPLTWLVFAFGASVVWTYYIYIVIKFGAILIRLYLMKDMIGMRPSIFLIQVGKPILLVTCIAVIPSLLLVWSISPSLLRLFLSLIVGIFSASIIAFFIGMTANEQYVIKSKVTSLLKRIV